MNEQDYKNEFLQSIFGAQSITKTVIGYYNLLDNDQNEDEDDENKLFTLMTIVCKKEGTHYQGQLDLLNQTFERLKNFRENRDEIITLERLQTTKSICETYVNWVFNNFPCFKKGDDGRFYFFPNS